jgi:hypothetical protein
MRRPIAKHPTNFQDRQESEIKRTGQLRQPDVMHASRNKMLADEFRLKSFPGKNLTSIFALCSYASYAGYAG